MKNPRVYIVVTACLVALSSFGQSGRTLVNDGNKLFKDEKFDQALSNYKEALGKKVPEDIVRYDLGNVYYKKDSYDQAERELEAAIQSKNPELQARGYFNRGNARFKQQQFDKSIEDYIEALKRNPKDIGAKTNLEIARRMLQMQQQQQQNQSKSDSTQQKQDQKQQQQQNQDQKKQEEQQKQQQEQQKQQEQEQKQDKSQQKAGEQEKQLSQAEAEKVLDALQNDEKEVLRELIKSQLPPTRPRGKDW